MTASSKKVSFTIQQRSNYLLMQRGVSSPKMNNFTRGEKNVNVAAIIQKFKKEDMPQHKKNEYKVLHMPRNTLLEPQNVVAAWGGGDEEKNEVSNTLRQLR